MNTIDPQIYRYIKLVYQLGASNDDLGYLLKWMIQYENKPNSFFKRINQSIEIKFFDKPNLMKRVYDRVMLESNEVNDQELSSFELGEHLEQT